MKQIIVFLTLLLSICSSCGLVQVLYLNYTAWNEQLFALVQETYKSKLYEMCIFK
jgi:hypothetical protein